MIPVTLNIHGGAGNKQFHYEVLNNAHLSPVAMMATVFNALHGVNEYGEDIDLSPGRQDQRKRIPGRQPCRTCLPRGRRAACRGHGRAVFGRPLQPHL